MKEEYFSTWVLGRLESKLAAFACGEINYLELEHGPETLVLTGTILEAVRKRTGSAGYARELGPLLNQVATRLAAAAEVSADMRRAKRPPESAVKFRMLCAWAGCSPEAPEAMDVVDARLATLQERGA